MSDDTKALATTSQKRSEVTAFSNLESFEGAARIASALAKSDLLPPTFKGKPENCLIALEIAQRTGFSPLAVMQGGYVVQGKFSWSGQFIIAAINSSGRFNPLKFRIRELGEIQVGNQKVRNKECVAYAMEREDGVVLEGPPVSIEMAVKEGWYGKGGSKWQTMPDLMLHYRAGTFFGRMYCPEILLGMPVDEEVRDVTPGNAAKSEKAAALNDKIRARKANVSNAVDDGPIETDIDDVEIVPTPAADAGPKERF